MRYLILIITSITMFQCSSSKVIQEKAPLEIGEVYFQKWNAGVQSAGSGLNIFIPVKTNAVQLDSVYFRGKGAKLIYNDLKKSYIGRFKSTPKVNKDIILSSDANEESKNHFVSPPKSEIPFELEKNECLVTYKNNNETEYFKISNIVEKRTLNYPTAPPKQ